MRAMIPHRYSLAGIAMVGCLVAQPSAQGGADAALVQKARAIHDRVITLDTHDDINPDNFTRQIAYEVIPRIFPAHCAGAVRDR